MHVPRHSDILDVPKGRLSLPAWRSLAEGEPGGDLDDMYRLAAIDERQGVLVERVEDELRADEGEDGRETVRQVDEPVEQPAMRKYSCRRPSSENAVAVKTR